MGKWENVVAAISGSSTGKQDKMDQGMQEKSSCSSVFKGNCGEDNTKVLLLETADRAVLLRIGTSCIS